MLKDVWNLKLILLYGKFLLLYFLLTIFSFVIFFVTGIKCFLLEKYITHLVCSAFFVSLSVGILHMYYPAVMKPT